MYIYIYIYIHSASHDIAGSAAPDASEVKQDEPRCSFAVVTVSFQNFMFVFAA